ncbi:MAG: MFS transporter [Alphaproteobacteria bacterium]
MASSNPAEAGPPAAPVPGGDRTVAVRISLYYAMLFGMVGIVQPYFPVWLQSRGLDATEIGLVMAAIMWVRVVSNPVAAGFADRLGQRKRVVTVLALGGALTGLFFPFAFGFWAVLAVAVLHTAIQAPVMPLGDNLILLTARERGLDYGRMRLWGSVAFIVTSVAIGAMLAGAGEGLIIWTIVACLFGVFVATALLPNRPTPPARRGSRPVAALLRTTPFLFFVLCGGLNMASHAVLNAFATIHWRAAGISEGVIGLLWAIGVIAEIVVFAYGRHLLGRLGIAGMMALGAGAGVVRWTGLAFTSDPLALLFFQSLHAFTFGAMHLGAMAFIQQAVPVRLSATAQALYASISMGVAVGLTTMASGLLYETLAAGAFLVMTLLSLASLGANLALRRVWRGGELTVEPEPARLGA